MKKRDITPLVDFPIALLHEYLAYNPSDGRLWWIKQASYRSPVGSVAGALAPDKYVRVGLHGRHMLAHRVVWAMYYGRWPTGVIDHINRDRSDNRIANLREVSQEQNIRNQPARSTNKLGMKGVWKKRGCYIASMCIEGRNITLGRFNTPEEAEACYRKAVGEHMAQLADDFTPPQIDTSIAEYKKEKLAQLPVEVIRKLIKYNLDGTLTWTIAHKRAGRLVGGIDVNGYVVATLRGRRLRGHHIVWALHHGSWPARPIEVDHINNVRHDNRIENLRLATRSQNASNAVRKFGRSGAKGVIIRGRKFLAKVWNGKKLLTVGRFDTIEEAKACHDKALLAIRGEFAAIY